MIVARESTIVFCEVKTRTSDRFGAPGRSRDAHEAGALARLAAAWLSARGVHGVDLRFDVASVMGERVEVIEAAF